MKVKMIASIMLMALSFSAAAEVTTGNTMATAMLANSCRLAVSNVVFGAYDPTSGVHQQSNQNVEILCTKGTVWTFYTDGPDYYLKYGAAKVNGINITAPDQYSYLKDSHSANFLLYQVLKSDGQWQPDLWQGAFVGAYKGKGTGASQALSIPYRILSSQFVPPNFYTAGVTAHIDF